jgi:hypothetical protein
VKPFDDRRQNLRFVCTFNLGQDLLCYSDESGQSNFPCRVYGSPALILYNDPNPVPLKWCLLPNWTSPSFPRRTRNPLPIAKRRLAFSSRVLSDIADQWRHILRSSYAESTFRGLAKALVSIETYDFRVDEVFTRQHIYFRSFYVTVLDVPSWERTYERHLFSIGGTTVVLHQDLQTALKIAKDEAKESSKVINPGDRAEQLTYLLVSTTYVGLPRRFHRNFLTQSPNISHGRPHSTFPFRYKSPPSCPLTISASTPHTCS